MLNHFQYSTVPLLLSDSFLKILSNPLKPKQTPLILCNPFQSCVKSQSPTGLLAMYLPVAITGYAVLGDAVEDNILLNVKTEKAVIKGAIVMEVLNLAGTYIITCNPVYQVFEEQLNIEKGKWEVCVCVCVD